MNHLGELLSAYLDGELLDHERGTVAGHLQACGRCRDELNDLAAARAAVRSLPLLELPVALAGRVGLAPDPIPLRHRPLVWASAAAAAVAAGFIGVATFNSPAPRQISPPEISAVYGAVSSNDPAFTPVKVAGVAGLVSSGAGR
jgi:anti-sigma factor RsiW